MLTKLKFRTRVLVGFCLILLLTVSFVILSIFQVEKFREESSFLHNNTYTVSNSVRDINTHIQIMESAMKDILLAKTQKEFDQAIDTIHHYHLKVTSEFETVYNKFLGDKRDVGIAYYTFEDWEEIRNQIIDLKVTGKEAEAKKMVDGIATLHLNKLKEKTKVMTDFSEEIALKGYQKASKNHKLVLIWFVIISVVIIIISLFITFIVSESISRPIKNFIAKTQSIYHTKSLNNNLRINEEQLLNDSISKLTETYSKLQQEITEREKGEATILTQYQEIREYSEQLHLFNESLEERVNERTNALAASEEKYRSLINGSSDVILVYEYSKDGTSKLIEVNDTACTFLGYPRKELKQLQLIDIIADINDQYTKQTVQRLSKEKQFTCEHFFISKNGVRTPMEVANQSIHLKGKHVILSTARDITERKNAEQKIIRSEKRLKKMIYKSPLAIVLIDNDWQIEYFNDKFTDLFGYTINEIKTTEDWFASFYPNELYRKMVSDTWQQAIEKAKNNHTDIEKQEFKVHAKSGEERHCEFFMVPLEPSSMIIINDITQITKTQKELVKAKEKAEESDRLKSAFLANMSHEIRTPMNGIIGFADMLRDPNKNSIQHKTYIDIIYKSSNQLLKIINDILDISKLDAGQTCIKENKCPINTILDDLYDLYLKENSADSEIQFKLNKALSDEAVFIISDERKIRQIISNLLNNAFKFTSSGTIEFGYQLINNEYLEFFVKDTGIGILPEKQEIIFQKFRQVEESFTRQYGGTGLGLAISKGYVSLLGGDIRLETKENIGTTFYFTIPYHPVDSSILIGHRKHYKWDDKLILVVEKDEDKYQNIKEALKPTKVKILRTISGNKAIELSLRNSTINLVLMDLNLPDINGWEATQSIKKMRDNLPVIAQATDSIFDDRDKSFEAGCDDYINDPFNQKQLLEVIEKHLSNKYILN